MKFAVGAALLATMACAAVPPEPAPEPDVDGGTARSCSVDALGDLVGRAAGEALGAEAMRRSGARALRWIRPGDMVTMDYSPDRLNIHLDARDRVERFACG